MSELPANERDPLARLIRSAGRRPAIPPAREERVHAAVRLAWQQTVRRRRMRRWIFRAGSGLLAATVAFALFMSQGRDTAPVATLEFSSGGVSVKAPGSPRALNAGDAISAGSTIETNDKSRAAFALSGGQSLRLDTSTRMKLESAQTILLEAGGVYIDSDRDGKKAAHPVEVRTGFGVARDDGTQFEVRLADDGVRVRVREGKVNLKRGSDSSTAESGTELTAHATGPVATAKVSLTDASWDWAASAAPPFKLEGATLQAYLSWVSREQGFETRFASEDLHQSAATIRLHGMLDGISPRKSLDAVIPVCGLAYTLNGGVLIISRPRP